MKLYSFVMIGFLVVIGCDKKSADPVSKEIGIGKLELPDEIDLLEYEDGIVKLQSRTESGPRLDASVSDFGQTSYKDVSVRYVNSEDHDFNNHTLILNIRGQDMMIILPKDE